MFVSVRLPPYARPPDWLRRTTSEENCRLPTIVEVARLQCGTVSSLADRFRLPLSVLQFR